ncbi:MAG: hypothetical protein KJ893_11185 [Candidatus Omnitrophica bacterium]|nr:hypothetical protein [Candidatus Omnitrophota bacterium]MBU4478337.1 hypothetical protein [Candidatus Omnitrophota bacterium]
MGVLAAIKKGWEIASGMVPVIIGVFLFNVVTALGLLMVIGINPTPDKITQITGLLAVFFIVLLLLWVLLNGGIFSAVYSQIKTKRVDLNAFMPNCLSFFSRLFGVNLIGFFLTVFLGFAGVFLAGIFFAMGRGQNIFFNIIAWIAIGITAIIAFLLMIILFLSQYCVVIDGTGVVASLKKGIGYFKQFFGKFCGVFLLVGVIIFPLSIGVNLIGNLLGKAIQGWPLAIINIIMNGSINAFISVFATASVMSLLLSVALVAAKPGEEAAEDKEIEEV